MSSTRIQHLDDRYPRSGLPQEIQDAELDVIKVRREAAGSGGVEGTDSLVGLALSGGGVRSAAFNLGVLQAFFSNGLLRSIDYLSTVSGGGYIGSWFSSRVHAQDGKLYDTGPKAELCRVLDRQPGGWQPPDIRRLAKRGKYLDRMGKAWNHFTVGTIYNNLAIFSILVFLCLLVAYCWRALDTELVTRTLYSQLAVRLAVPGIEEPLSWVPPAYLLKETVRPFLPFGLLAVLWLTAWSLQYGHYLWHPFPASRSLGKEGWVRRGFALLLLALALAVAGVVVLLVWALNQLLLRADDWAGVASIVFWVALGVGLYWQACSKSRCWKPVWSVLGALFAKGHARRGGRKRAATRDSADRPTHRSVGAALAAVSDTLFVVAVAALAIGVVAWLAIPVQNTSAAGDRPRTVANTSDWTQRVVYPLLGLLLTALTPFLRPKKLLRSGVNPQNAWEGWVFTIATSALLFGVPLSLIWLFAEHDFARRFSLPLAQTPAGGIEDLGDRPWYHPPTLPDRARELEPGDVVNLNGFRRGVKNDQSAYGPGKFIDEALSRADAHQTELKLWWAHGPVADAGSEFFRVPGVALSSTPEFEGEFVLRRQLADALNSKVISSPVFTARVWKEGHRRPPGSGSDDKPGSFDEGELFRTVLAQHPEAGRISALMTITQSRDLKEPQPELNRLLFEAYYGQLIHRRDTVVRPNVIGRDQAWRRFWLGVTGVVAVVSVVVVSLNATSMHGFYRDRLAETFVHEPAGPLPLDELNTTRNGAPYHLLSGTVTHRTIEEDPSRVDPENLGQTRTEGFLMSPLYCGADGLGYEPTADYRRRLTLADAMTISGAAVSPLQLSSWFIVALMVVANARTGQWLPRPRGKREEGLKWWDRLRCWAGGGVARVFGPTFFGIFASRLISKSNAETTSPATDGDAATGSKRKLDLRAVHFVTDGGHHENLGVWPLLERRCRLIIASDASEDRTSGLADLLRVIRRARRERGIRITGVELPRTQWDGVASAVPPDTGAWEGSPGEGTGLSELLELLRPTDEPTDRELKQRESEGKLPHGFCRSHRHYFVAKIEYPRTGKEPGRSGYLVYLKPTLTGDEDTDLQYYAAQNRDFPHHPTSDQLYDEDRFESYRQLGEHIGDQLCNEVGQTDQRTLGTGIRSMTDPAAPATSRDVELLIRQANALFTRAAEKTRRRGSAEAPEPAASRP